MNGIIMVFAVILSSAIIIYFVKNNKEIINRVKKSSNKKLFKVLLIISTIVLILLVVLYFKSKIEELNSNIASVKRFKENDKAFNEYEKKVEEENDFYSECISKSYNENFNKPYILDGFKYVEGDWNTGFVIEDENKNQFVWVPVYNIKKQDVVILIKKDFIVGPNIPKEVCLDENYEKFIKSALENGGFYISRYEMGVDGEKMVSQKGKKIFSNITKKEAIDKIENMYKNTDFSCELINGYAYDTAIEWINFENNIKTVNVNTDSEVLSGRTSNKNIFDMFDNIFEYTRRSLL